MHRKLIIQGRKDKYRLATRLLKKPFNFAPCHATSKKAGWIFFSFFWRIREVELHLKG